MEQHSSEEDHVVMPAPLTAYGSQSHIIYHGMIPSPLPNPPFKKSPVKYKECLRNHAASVGGYSVDGCGEFMPSGQEGTLAALTCSACACHRNFHRKQIEKEPSFHDPDRMIIGRKVFVGTHQMFNMPCNVETDQDGGRCRRGAVKKRFRTKFSQEQKEKLRLFAEKVGWKMVKQEEDEVQRFCQEVGIKRGVLKVWMHNNKNSLAKKCSHVV